VGFVEPFGNLLEAFERGRFQTPWNVVSKGAQWFPSQKNDFAPRLDAGSVKDSVMPLLVSVKIGFLEPFGNLLGAFERGCFQTPWNVVLKGARWFLSQKNSKKKSMIRLVKEVGSWRGWHFCYKCTIWGE
jgi:hypothetical protein